MIRAIRHVVVDQLEFRSIVKHRSRLGRHFAPAYSAYWRRCRDAFGRPPVVTPDIECLVEEFERKGFTTFWTAENRRLADRIYSRIREEEAAGKEIWDENLRYRREIYTTFPEIEELFAGSLGAFLTAAYRSHFKIFFGILYKSERRGEAPTGSQLWHADGGPGTCINVMFYLKDVEREDGAMECLPWQYSLEGFRNELAVVRRFMERKRGKREPCSKDEVRQVKCEYFRERIAARYAGYVEQPTGTAGLVLPFRNNILHKGGYPEPGRDRYACVFHCYPSDRPTPFDRYRQVGIPKTASYPADPAAEF